MPDTHGLRIYRTILISECIGLANVIVKEVEKYEDVLPIEAQSFVFKILYKRGSEYSMTMQRLESRKWDLKRLLRKLQAGELPGQ